MWVKLRNAFIAAKKRRHTKSGQAAKKIAPWKFGIEMTFLILYLEMRETHSNLDNTTDANDVEEIPDNHSIESETENNVQSNVKKAMPYNPCRKNPNPAQEMVEIMKHNASMRMKRYETEKNENQTESKNLDEVDMFYLSMAKTVKRLPQLEQAKIRMALCQLVSEAEIRTIEKNAVQHSTSSSLGSRSPLVSPPAMSPVCNLDEATQHTQQPSYSGSNFWTDIGQYHNM